MENKKKTTQVKKTNTKKSTTRKVQTKKTNTKKSTKKAFTLIELLAVIIILGVLMIIAIPSVTRYIQDSRKNAYITTAHNFIDSARVMANSGELPMYDPETTYYIPKECISLEKGGDSPFGEFTDAYVVVTYNGKGYDYYWTSNDVTHNGIYLTYEGLLDVDSVMSDVESISPNIGVGDRENIIVFDEGTCNTVKTESTASDYVEEQGKITELGIDYENADYDNYLKFASASTSHFGYSFDKDRIEKITFKNSKSVPNDAVALGSIPTTGADVSNKKNGSIMMWVTDKDSNGMYELFIGQDGGVVANADSRYLFKSFYYLELIDVTYLNTKNATNMSYMFSYSGYKSSKFKILGLSNLKTSNVTDMSYMFDNTCRDSTECSIGDLSKWDVSKVTNMNYMFFYLEKSAPVFYIGDLSKWNVSNVTSMHSMFCNAGINSKEWSIGDISNWNVSNVTDMNTMFASAGRNATICNISDLSKWNTSNVTNMESMFAYAGWFATTKVDPKVSGWNVSKVTSYDEFNYNSSWITPPTWFN